MAKTIEDRIKTVYGGGGQVVILGAGASIASTFRNPEPYGKRLPSMDNFIDVEAVSLMNTAWGTADKRDMEQFEIIDIRPEEEGVKRWSNFIHSHHYDYTTNYFSSSLAYNPRSTFESYFQHIMPMTPSDSFSASNPVPSDIKTLQELWDWHKPLIDAENEWKEEQKKQNEK